MANGGERPISEFEDILRLIRPFGRWQITTCILAAFTGMFTSFFVLIHSFVGSKIPHYCRVPALSSSASDSADSDNITITISSTNWTEFERREFSIPPKISSHPPAIGQPFQPCMSFDIDYSQYMQLDYTAAWLKRIMNDPAPSVTKSCRDGWEFNTTESQYPSSVQMEWNLTCHSSYLLPLSQSIFMIGFLFGVLLSGALSDAYGRKRILVYAAVLGVIFSFLTAAAPSYTTYVLCRFMCAFSLSSAYTIGFVLCMEIIGPAHRSLVGFAYQLPWTCGYLILPCAAYIVRNWRWLHVVLAAPCCLMLTYYWLLPESPRWLILRGFVVEARVELERAAKRNGVVLPSKLPLHAMHRQQLLQQQREAVLHSKSKNRRRRGRNIVTTPQIKSDGLNSDFSSSSAKPEIDAIAGSDEFACSLHNTPVPGDVLSANIIENETPRSNCRVAPPLQALGLRRQFWLMWNGLSSLFTYRRMRRRTFIQFFIWFVNAIVYYGLAFYSTRLEGHLYLNFFLGGAVEFPAYVLGYFAYKRFGRRLPLVFAMLLGGSACFAVSIMSMCDVIGLLPITTLLLSISGKFFITSSFGMIYIYSSELFPTMLRNVGLGSCSTMARVGSAVAPFVLRLGDNIWHPLPMLVFGSLATIAGICVLLLPETWHAQLPETVEAAENFGLTEKVREGAEDNEFHSSSRNQRNFGSSGGNDVSGRNILSAAAAGKFESRYVDEFYRSRNGQNVSSSGGNRVLTDRNYHLAAAAGASAMTIPDESETDEDANMLLDVEVRSGAAMPSPNALQQAEFLQSNPHKKLEPPASLYATARTSSPSTTMNNDDSRLEVRSGAAMPSPDVMQQNDFDGRRKKSLSDGNAPLLLPPRQHHPRSSIFSPHVHAYTRRNNMRNPNSNFEAEIKRRLSKAFVAAKQPEIDSIDRSFDDAAKNNHPINESRPGLMGKASKSIPVINVIAASGSTSNNNVTVVAQQHQKTRTSHRDTVDNNKKAAATGGAASPAVSWKIYEDST